MYVNFHFSQKVIYVFLKVFNLTLKVQNIVINLLHFF